ncbi:thiazole synthase [Stappia sp. TSB10P1A]|uniref:thiazole synthase n=1 Tax=Stappia sp. TSB10P1A TaxID=2003585 RepID=UPI001643E65E|nr:thiazole synthase [Stappia sp. TSB10P1A]
MPVFYGETVESPLLLGTALYPSPAIMAEAVRASGCDIVTVSLRRESGSGRAGQDFWGFIRDLGVRVLPNTAGCHSVREAVTTAKMAREVFGTPWIKLEVINDAETLAPDVFGLVEAARILSGEGFQVFPYCTEDLGVAERLIEAGCEVLMPWGAPIGSARGLNNVYGLRSLRAHFPNVPLVVDAGLGVPSHAAAAMELGYDAVLLNTAVAKAGDPVAMASAFAKAVEAGRLAFAAGAMEPRDMAAPSTPVLGKAFLE